MKVNPYLFSGILIVISTLLICLVVWFRCPGVSVPEVSPVAEETVYLNYFLEGQVVSISKEEPTSFVLEATLSRIEPGVESAEVNIQLTGDTELVIHNTNTGEEQPFEFSEIGVGDYILVDTQEPPFIHKGVINRTTFTARRLTKIVF